MRLIDGIRKSHNLRDSIENKGRMMSALTITHFGKRGQRVFMNSIPKSGTHLLRRCLALMPGMMYAGIHINRVRYNQYQNIYAREQLLTRLGRGIFVSGHLPFQDSDWQALQTWKYVTVLMIRDPRDVVVSQWHHTLRRPTHRMHNYIASIADPDVQLTCLIKGIADNVVPDTPGILSIGKQFQSFLGWYEHGAHLVRFENLIGAQGGGSPDRQSAEIEELASYVGIDLTRDAAEQIADKVFDRKANTFRKGTIGDWRTHFSDDHKKYFKAECGQLLIDLGYEANWEW